MPNPLHGRILSTWKRILDLQLRLRNPRLGEAEQDRLHGELRDALARFRAAYAEEALGRRRSQDEPSSTRRGADPHAGHAPGA